MLLQRVIRAARLDRSLYNEVEADTKLTTEAILVVIITAAASGLGWFLFELIFGFGFGSALLALIVGVVFQLIGFAIFAFICYFVGTQKFIGGTATYQELVRTLGYAQGPKIFTFLVFIPVIGLIVNVVVWIWTLITSFIAIQESLDVDQTKALITAAISWAIFIVVGLVLDLIPGVRLFGFF